MYEGMKSMITWIFVKVSKRQVPPTRKNPFRNVLPSHKLNFITLIILFGTIASAELMKSLQCSYVILLKAKRNVSKEPLEEKGFKYSQSLLFIIAICDGTIH